MTFNHGKDKAKVCGSTVGVAWKQGDSYYNNDFQEVDEVTGKPVAGAVKTPPPPPAEAKGKKAAAPKSFDTVEELLAAKVPFFIFKSQAAKFLGDDPVPSLKDDIVGALKAKAGINEVPAAPVAQAAAPAADDDANVAKLRSWVDKRIAQKYLFGDIQKAIREKYAKSVHNERDAVNFLVDDAKLVEAQYAINAA